MTDKVLILVTTPSRREARKLGRHLVDTRLAACVNISQAIQSIYRWKNKLVEDEEFLLQIKSTRDLFPEVRRAIQNTHSYKIPEIICLPIVDGSPDYLSWLGESLKAPAPLESIVSSEEQKA